MSSEKIPVMKTYFPKKVLTAVLESGATTYTFQDK